MANPDSKVLLTKAELALWRPGPESSGAIVDFWGVVRRFEGGSEISGIDYEAHPAMAEHQLQLIADEAIQQFGLQSIVIHHRLGFVAVNEASVFVRATSENRVQAFPACQWVMDELKKRVPIWKRPKFKMEQERQEIDEPTSVVSRR